MLPETVARIADSCPNVTGIKEASGNISQVAKLASLVGDRLDIYSGNDDQILPILSLGGKGVISVLSNVVPGPTHDIVARWFDGDVKGSCALQLQLLDLASALFSDVNPIPVKEAMNQMGMNVGPCRLPLYAMDEKGKNALAAVLRRHGLIA